MEEEERVGGEISQRVSLSSIRSKQRRIEGSVNPVLYLPTDQREKAYFLLSGFSLEWQETKINRAKDTK